MGEPTKKKSLKVFLVSSESSWSAIYLSRFYIDNYRCASKVRMLKSKYGQLQYLEIFFSMAKPVLKGKIVSYFNKDKSGVSEETVYYYAVLLIVCCVATTFLFNCIIFAFELITLRLKTAITSLIYRKSLRLNSSFTSKSASGQAVTLITKDVDMLDFALYVIPRMAEGVVNIMIMLYMMYVQIGVSAFTGALVLVVVVPVQGKVLQ